jgi:hypothetical protein
MFLDSDINSSGICRIGSLIKKEFQGNKLNILEYHNKTRAKTEIVYIYSWQLESYFVLE